MPFSSTSPLSPRFKFRVFRFLYNLYDAGAEFFEDFVMGNRLVNHQILGRTD